MVRGRRWDCVSRPTLSGVLEREGVRLVSWHCRPGREESHILEIPGDAAGVRSWCLAESLTVLLGRDVMWLEKDRVEC